MGIYNEKKLRGETHDETKKEKKEEKIRTSFIEIINSFNLTETINSFLYLPMKDLYS